MKCETCGQESEIIIDLDTEPHIPEGWSIHLEDQITSRATGMLVWDPLKVKLHLDPAQEGDGGIKGTNLIKNLEGQPVLPANVLDYLLDHPALIPSEWKGKDVYFWTVYRDEGGRLYVRCLYWNGGHWRWLCSCLDNGWDDQDPAAISAS